MLLPWAGFLLQRNYAWNAPLDRVRAYLIEFLRDEVGCQISSAAEDSYLIETTAASPLSKSSLGVLLAALTSLYDVLTDASYYPYQNPMRSELRIALKRDHLRRVKNAGAPDHAGIRSETHQETYQRYPTTSFQQKRGKIWEPEVVMEPDAVLERMQKTINFMIEHATFQRDQIILLLLRQTGARLSEVIEMTVGGYRKACHTGRALVKNKGSHGREEKILYFTDVIEAQLQTYIRTERADYDRQGYKRIEQLYDQDPFFLTEDGKPYSRSAFYYHWEKLFRPAQKQFKQQEQVAFSPHDIRHLRVTRALAKIKEEAQGDEGIEKDLREGFSQLMGWSSPRTMDIYTHTLNKRDALLKVMLAEEEDEPKCQILQASMPRMPIQERPSSQEQIAPAIDPPNDDDFSWYEEE